MNKGQKETDKGWEHTEVISDARRSRSWTKKESSSFVLDMGVIVEVKDGRSASAGALEIRPRSPRRDHASRLGVFVGSYLCLIPHTSARPNGGKTARVRDLPRVEREVRTIDWATSAQSSSRPLRRLGMSTRDAEEEFEFLLNLLASDGVGPDPGQPRGAPGDEPDDDDRGVRVQRGTDGRLDLGQVRAFYESKNMRGGLEETRGPVSTDRPRNNTG